MSRQTHSFWNDSICHKPGSASLEQDLTADVIVVGAGITGLMTAYELHGQGASVVVVEKGRIGSGECSRTTAHLTCMTDVRLGRLCKDFGTDHALAVWDAGSAAIERIHEVMHSEGIDCSFSWVPGYLHHSLSDGGQVDVEGFKSEVELARNNGFECEYLDSVPVVDKPGYALARQAKFHPLEFVNGLASALTKKGVRIYENSEVTQFSSEDSSMVINGRSARAKTIVMATHVPLQGRLGTTEAALFQTKLYPYTSYVIRAKIQSERAVEALFWDTDDPYNYLRIDREGSEYFAIFGGSDEKTGQEHAPQTKFDSLETKLRQLFPNLELTHRWAGQVIETNDGLPFIGEFKKGQFVATGFSGNGFTFGTVAAGIISDAIAGIKNPWSELFDADRVKIKGGTWDYLKENLDYPYYMAKQYLVEGVQKRVPSSLRSGEGAILSVNNEKVAACRVADGTLHTVSPKCTHMGCFVRWNSALESWDCPCHGSRFAADGRVLGGPAERDLEPKSVE